MNDRKVRTPLKVPYTLRVAKLMADELRIKIVSELNQREMSPKSFFEEFGGGSIARVSRAFDLLAEYGWIYETRTETGGRRRGAVEHFYRATGPAVFYDDTWSPLPRSMKEMISGGIFEELVARVKEALEAGTIDARADRHLSWMPRRLDQEGWENVVGWIDELFVRILDEQERANLRMAESGEEPIPVTVALAAFESPKAPKRLP